MAILKVPTSAADLKHLEQVVDAVTSRNSDALTALGCSPRQTGAPRAFHHYHQNGNMSGPTTPTNTLG